MRESACMEQYLFDSDGFLAVRGELGDDLGHPLLELQEAVFEEQPDGDRHDGLRRGEDAVQRLVACGLFLSALHGRPECP